MKFSEIAGHDDVKATLRNMVDSGKLPHALLLSGPAGIGKTKLARALASYIQCQNRQGGDSCGHCPACRQTDTFNNPDLHYVYPVIKEDKKTLSLDYIDEWKEFLKTDPMMSMETWLDILEAPNKIPLIYSAESEEIIRVASLSAYSHNFKVFIVWLPEQMNADCSNKLLKILEEPYPDTVFILVSNEPWRLLPTIFSRTVRLTMHPGATTEVPQASEEERNFSTRFQEMMRTAYRRDGAALKKMSEQFAEFPRPKLLRYLHYCSRMVRENFIRNMGNPSLVRLTPEEEAFSANFSRFINERNVEALATTFQDAIRDIGGNGSAKVVMMSVMLYLASEIRK